MNITFLGSGNIRSNFSYRILKLAAALHKQGHQVTIIVPSADKYNNFISENISSIDGVVIRQPFQFNTKSMVLNLVPYIISAAYAVLKEKSDLIYIYKPTPVSIVGLLGKLFHGTPVVLDMDDLGSEVMKIEGHPAYQRKLVEWSEKITAYYADKIIAASTYLYDMYKKKFPTKPIHVMSNGVDSEWFIPVKKHDNKKRIVFMGSMNRKNILEPLFEIAPALINDIPNLEIILMGGGTYLDYFKQKALDLHISANVTFTGWVSVESLKDNLFAGDIGYNYMPYDRTVLAASNMKVPQYMSRGVLPIVSDMGDLPASIDHGQAGYIASVGHDDALLQTLRVALQDSASSKKSEHARMFAEKHYDWDVLATDAEGFLGIEKVVHMKNTIQKIYVVATNVPGNFGGAEIRNLNLIKQLSRKADSSVEIFCIAKEDPEEARASLEKEMGVRAHVVLKKRKSIFTSLRALVYKRVQPVMEEYALSGLGEMFYAACQQQLPDVVQIEQITAYYCVQPYIAWLRKNGVRIILDTHNVEAALFKSSLEIFPPLKKMVGKFLLPKIWCLEIDAAKASDVVIACSTTDAAYFKKFNDAVHVIPNGVDCAEFTPAEKKQVPHAVLFIGGVEYPPNADAVRFYLKKIHPKLKKQLTDVTVDLIGATPEWLEREGFGHDSSVHGLGFVEDIKPYLDHATVGICPVRYGSGTRLKILTYMSAGLPVISTTKGAEGIGYTQHENIVIANEPATFVQGILDILSNNMHYVNMSRKSREFVLEQYDWNVIGTSLLAIY